ncbi:MAG: asparagine synthase (glutamine-hydrolyzing) [Acidimicrobiales bacterium]|jgi:asparagine synthase (glutamine-hydrolysing)|nr:asparagine synthase (glutamine-hydrolyzing) [Acidimicrobiales bacterium]
MCGIGGVVGPSQWSPTEAALRRACDLLAHRGPDDHGVLVAPGVGLAHTRLSLLDLTEAGHQPWTEANHALVFNGEIYNYRSLRTDLEREGEVFRSTSDTEVLFRSLVRHGVDATLPRLRGMFAFAFVDLEAGTAWLCRDRFGIKPLVFTERNGRVAFASEAKALTAFGPLEPDPIVSLFATTGMPEHSATRTAFHGVRQVAPGTCVEVHAGRVTAETVWFDLLDQIDEATHRRLASARPASVVEEFEALLAGGVEATLVADAPLGVFVSGGIDSSLIAALARDRARKDFALFSANVVGRYSEIDAARLLAGTLRRPLVVADFEPGDLLERWAECTWHYESPLVKHTNAMPFAAIARRTADAGVKAVLTGEGSDELFLGYPPLLFDRYRPLVEAPRRAVERLYGLSPTLAGMVLPERRNASRLFVGQQLVQRFERQRIDSRTEQALAHLPRRERQIAGASLGMVQEHLLSLLHRNDRMGMLAGIESRFPFLDDDLVRFAVNLPARYKIGRSLRPHNLKHPFLVDKAIVREAASVVLPPELAERPKEGFPMYGLRDVRLRHGAFAGGFVADLLELDATSQRYLIDHAPPYETAKLFSVEVFGRLFGLGEPIDKVTAWVRGQARVEP